MHSLPAGFCVWTYRQTDSTTIPNLLPLLKTFERILKPSQLVWITPGTFGFIAGFIIE
jgi:hypothetical protein